MVTILFLGANPSDQTRLALGREVREITSRLRVTPMNKSLDLQQEWAVRSGDLQAHLLRARPAMVHFSGHGSRSGQLLFEDDAGSTAPISAEALAGLFRLLGEKTRCVVLNACYSEKEATAISKHVDCVVGMTTAVSDTAAMAFSGAFYQALGFGENFQTAFELGRNQIDLSSLSEADTPIIRFREGCNPEDVRLRSGGT